MFIRRIFNIKQIIAGKKTESRRIKRGGNGHWHFLELCMADLKQMWAHNCHSFVVTTGLNGRWVKDLVLSSRSVRAFEVPAEDVHRTGAHKPERATPVVFLPTAFSQINLFLAPFFSTFSRENGSTFPYACVSVGTIVTKRSKCYQNIKNTFLVSGF